MPRDKGAPPRGDHLKKRPRPGRPKPRPAADKARGLKTQSTAPPINIRTASSRRKTMPASVALVAALFFIFVSIYMVRAVHSELTPNVAVEVVRMGNRETQHSVTGMIVRYEEVVYAPRDGQVLWSAANLDRVRRGTLVAGIVDMEAMERINRDREALEEEMQRINDRRHYSEVDPAVQRINNTLRSAVNSSMHYFSTLSLAEINTLYTQLDNFTETRIRMIVADSHGAVGADLTRQHDMVMLQYGMSSTNINAPRSGIMFNIVDGHENEVTPANMMELSQAEINTLVDHATIFPARDVEAGEAVFKIVGNTWYIVAHMPNNMVEGFTAGFDRTIFVQNANTGIYEPITMRIVHIEQFAIGSRVIFRSNRYVMDFLNQRNISIRTTNDISHGLQISTSAIVTRRTLQIPTTHIHERGGYSVHVNTAEGIRQVPIDVLEMTEDYAFVSEDNAGLFMGDSLIPASLFAENFVVTENAVRIEHGVYRTTLGSATFTPIVLGDEFSEADTFTLLDPALNRHLRQFDTIVTDAQSVNEGDLIR